MSWLGSPPFIIEAFIFITKRAMAILKQYSESSLLFKHFFQLLLQTNLELFHVEI